MKEHEAPPTTQPTNPNSPTTISPSGNPPPPPNPNPNPAPTVAHPILPPPLTPNSPNPNPNAPISNPPPPPNPNPASTLAHPILPPPLSPNSPNPNPKKIHKTETTGSSSSVPQTLDLISLIDSSPKIPPPQPQIPLHVNLELTLSPPVLSRSDLLDLEFDEYVRRRERQTLADREASLVVDINDKELDLISQLENREAQVAVIVQNNGQEADDSDNKDNIALVVLDNEVQAHDPSHREDKPELVHVAESGAHSISDGNIIAAGDKEVKELEAAADTKTGATVSEVVIPREG